MDTSARCYALRPKTIVKYAFTKEIKSHKFLKNYASQAILSWFELNEAFKFKTFHLNKHIRIEVYWENNFEAAFIQNKISKIGLPLNMDDYVITLKGDRYVLRSFPAINKYRIIKNISEKQNQSFGVNFEKALNSIEYDLKPEIKYRNPIYTGMKN
jgi:hypothetical protein